VHSSNEGKPQVVAYPGGCSRDCGTLLSEDNSNTLLFWFGMRLFPFQQWPCQLLDFSKLNLNTLKHEHPRVMNLNDMEFTFNLEPTQFEIKPLLI
jgi:hypothetical protein